MIRFCTLVLLVLSAISMVVLGRGPIDTGELLFVGEETQQGQQVMTRKVVYQPPAEQQNGDGSMLPDAVRGFWNKDKSKPGIDGEDTMKWANETFEALKKKGLTTANDAGSWLTQDYKNMNAWEYKVVFIADNTPIGAERALNQLGAESWECFHVQPQATSTMFYFKKPKRSYLKSLPTSDLMRLLPMMGGE